MRLWRTDGTARGTVALKTFAYTPTGLIAVGDTLFFRIDGYGHYGQFLWKSDGTAAGTVLVKGFNHGFDISISLAISPLVEVGGRVLLFAGPDGAAQLWSSDGTEAGTVIVRGFSGARHGSLLTALDDRAFFLATTPEVGLGLWQSDGTDAGTALVGAVPANFSAPSQMIAGDGMVFFDASDGAHGTELWRSDGTAAGTTLVRDIRPGSERSNPSALADLDGTLYFAADDGAHGAELWRSDGTADGTTLVEDIAPGSGGSTPTAMAALNGALLFAADDGAHGAEPWRSDGTAGGTALVRNLAADDTVTADSAPTDLAEVSGVLVFRADDGVHGAELWRSDGTAAGTTLVTDINPGPAGSTADIFEGMFGVIDGSLYFLATDADHGVELWKTDGSPQGTARLKDIAPGPAPSYPFSLAQLDGALLFDADDGGHGPELWTSDGSSDGTRLLRDLTPGPHGSYPQDFTDVNGTLFFRAVPELHGGQLWRTDGSDAGTVLLKSFSGFFQIWRLVGLGGRLVFTADDGAVGDELSGQRRHRRGHGPARGHRARRRQLLSRRVRRHERTALLPGGGIALADRWHRGRHGAGCRGLRVRPAPLSRPVRVDRGEGQPLLPHLRPVLPGNGSVAERRDAGRYRAVATDHRRSGDRSHAGDSRRRVDLPRLGQRARRGAVAQRRYRERHRDPEGHQPGPGQLLSGRPEHRERAGRLPGVRHQPAAAPGSPMAARAVPGRSPMSPSPGPSNRWARCCSSPPAIQSTATSCGPFRSRRSRPARHARRRRPRRRPRRPPAPRRRRRSIAVMAEAVRSPPRRSIPPPCCRFCCSASPCSTVAVHAEARPWARESPGGATLWIVPFRDRAIVARETASDAWLQLLRRFRGEDRQTGHEKVGAVATRASPPRSCSDWRSLPSCSARRRARPASRSAASPRRPGWRPPARRSPTVSARPPRR